MNMQNTFVQADEIVKVQASDNCLPKSERGGRPVAYLLDRTASVLTAVNTNIEFSSVLLDTLSSGSKSFLASSSGYITDDNSTSVLKTIDANEIWIQENAGQLTALLRMEDVESGIINPSELFVKRALNENKILALQMINKVYFDNLGNSHIQIGVLHLSSYIDYKIAYPTLQTMAFAALSDCDDDVKDYAVRCYAYWNHPDGIRALNTIRSDAEWLQNYINDVIRSLSDAFPEVTPAQ